MRTIDEIRNELTIIDQSTLERYRNYFQGLRPQTPEDLLRRFLFAYLSIQTSWETNVRLYSRLKSLEWLHGTLDELRQVFVDMRVGLHNHRAEYIWELGRVYLADPQRLWRHPMESWQAYRDRLARTLPGLGLTKSAFVIEMCWPEADVVCLDRHMLSKFFGWKRDTLGPVRYRLFERRFCWACGNRDPGLVRMAIWDKMKGQSDPAYWANCLAN